MRAFLLLCCLMALASASATVASNATATGTDLQALRAEFQAQLDDMAASNDRTWMMSSAFTILQMQAGFAMLEAGSTSSTSTASILMKNMADLAVGTLGFFLVGWGLAFGPSNGDENSANPLFGTGDFALASTDINLAAWVFQLSFAATAATIVSGAVAGRIKFKLYVILSIVITSVVYPIPAHVAWDPRGFGYQLGFVDFAGSGVVHAAGGLMGLLSTLRLGPRTGVFSASGAYFPVRSSPTTAILGVFILIWCWFSFNAGSTASVSGGADRVAALAAVNTAMASGAGSVAGMAFSWVRSGGRYIDVYETANGALCALVGITAGCASVLPWEAAIIGLLAAVLGNWVTTVLVRLRVDDPVGVTPVHLVSGVFGVLMVGLFANDPAERPGLPVPQSRPGLFHGGGFHQLGIQALLIVFILAWSFVAYGAILLLLDRTLGLRVSKDEERMLDALEHNLLMVKVQEAIGATGSTENTYDEDEDGEWLTDFDRAERGAAVHPGHSSRVLAAQGQLMTMGAGLDQQPHAVTIVQDLEEDGGGAAGDCDDDDDSALDVTDGGSVRKRKGTAVTAQTLAKAAGPKPGHDASFTTVGDPTSPHPTAPSSGAADSSGVIRTTVSSGSRRVSAPSVRDHAGRSSSSGKPPRRKRGKGGRRRSMAYVTEEVTYMTAEELAAAHSGHMDETTVDKAVPAELSKHMASGSMQQSGAGPSAASATNSAKGRSSPAQPSAGEDSKPAPPSAVPSESSAPVLLSGGDPAEADLLPPRAKPAAGATPVTAPAAAKPEPAKLAAAGRQQSSRRGPRRTGSRAAMDVQGWQAPGAVEASALPSRNARSRRDLRRVQYQAQSAGQDGACAQQ